MGLIGYARISTIEGAQVLDRQLDALNAAGCERIFEDRASGPRLSAPALQLAWTSFARATCSWFSIWIGSGGLPAS